MPYGFHNKILRVNLSSRQISVEQPGEHFYRTYFGGWGVIAYYLLKELEPETDPLGPANKLIFALGPVTGTPIIGSGRNGVGAKSPLTGGIALSQAGGYWGYELKRAGFDALIIEGTSKDIALFLSKTGASLTSVVEDNKRVPMRTMELMLGEAVVLPDSPFVGRTVGGLGLNRHYGVKVLAIQRRGRHHRHEDGRKNYLPCLGK